MTLDLSNETYVDADHRHGFVVVQNKNTKSWRYGGTHKTLDDTL